MTEEVLKWIMKSCLEVLEGIDREVSESLL
nr:MAG TPA: hypothetical protein [Bacteriophage sp.]